MRIVVIFLLAFQVLAEFCLIVGTRGGAAIDGVPAATPQYHAYTHEAYHYKRKNRYSPQDMFNQVAAVLGRMTRGLKSV